MNRKYSTTPREDVRVRANDLIALDLTRRQYMARRDDAVRSQNWQEMQALTYVLDVTYDRTGATR